MSEKTEQPTPKRLAKARSEGDSPLSAALSQSVGFVAALAVVGGAIAVAAEQASALIRAALARPLEPATPGTLARVVLGITLPVLAASAAASAAASFAQTGGVFSVQKLSPSFDRLNAFTGLKNLFSWQRIVGIGRALIAASAAAPKRRDFLAPLAARLKVCPDTNLLAPQKQNGRADPLPLFLIQTKPTSRGSQPCAVPRRPKTSPPGGRES